MAKNELVERALLRRQSDLVYVNRVKGRELQRAQFGTNTGADTGARPRAEPGFRKFWRCLRRHSLVFWTVVILITGLSVFINLRARSIYLASTTMVVGSEGNDSGQAGEPANRESGDATITAIKTNLVLIQSHELLEDVIVDLQLDRDPKFLKGQKQGVLDRLPDWVRHETSLAVKNANPAGPAEKETLRTAGERSRLDPWVRAIASNLRVEQLGESRVLKISFAHTDPEIAAAVADSVAEHFRQRAFLSQTEKLTNTDSWLKQVTAELKRRMEQAEQALVDYSRANRILTVDGNTTLITGKIGKLQDQVNRAEADRIIKEALYDEVKRGRVSAVPDAFSETISKSAPRIRDLEKQLDDLATNEAQLSVSFGPTNPQVQAVREQISAVKAQIAASRRSLDEQLRVAYEHSVREERELKRSLAAARAEAVSENQAVIQYGILKQEMETAKALYTEFLQKSTRSQLQIAGQRSNLRIVDHAKVPTVAFGPPRVLSLCFWFTVALLAGIAAALLLDFLKHTFEDTGKSRQSFQLPTLAVIPRLTARSRRLAPGLPGRLPEQSMPAGMGLRPQSGLEGQVAPGKAVYIAAGHDTRRAMAEAYRILRTSILRSNAEWTPKTILVTSANQGDGKTTTVLNLGFALCEVGARVLIIDADLRRSILHQLLRLGRGPGLSTCLSGDAAPELLIRQHGHPRLSILSAGPTHHDPAGLLSSTKMGLLLERLSDSYDFIMLDSPSFGAVGDAAILSTMVDGVLLVAQADRSRREGVIRAKYDLMKMGARVMGVVLNNVHQKGTASDFSFSYNSSRKER